ncbi:hypothetical protein [Nocardioides sp. LHG3406-4]|uniref:hypothetical protein n=1 Tax=Nocardioides sp. LHG3406-4 TaxID=2804575 RepID=UPI003CE95334
MTRQVSVANLRTMAQRVLDHVHIEDIRLKSLSCDSSDVLLAGPFEVSTGISFRGVPRNRQAVECWIRYIVDATAGQADSDYESSKAWGLQLELIANFERNNSEELLPDFSADELEAFAFALGVMHVHPYARETVQSATSRLGYPPFTLDTILPPTAHPDDEVIDLESAEDT